MRKQRVIQAVADCTDPRDYRAGIGDICDALGKGDDQDEVKRITDMLRNGYRGYVDVVADGGCVSVKQRTLVESARNERTHARRVQMGWATATTLIGVLLGFFMGKYFG